MDIDYFDEAALEMDTITAQQVEDLCKLLYEQKIKVESIDDVRAEESKKLETLKSKILSYLQHFRKDNYRSAYGLVSKKTELDAKIIDKESFIEYLKGKQMLEGFATFNATRVKGLVRQELDSAKEEKREFSIPGISEITFRDKLSIRKGKENAKTEE